MRSDKYYVVWKGYAPGIYDSWEEAEIQVSGYPGAQYHAFQTLEAATEAFREGYDKEGLIQDVVREMHRLQTEGVKVKVKESSNTASTTSQAQIEKSRTTNKQSANKPRRLTSLGIRNVKAFSDHSDIVPGKTFISPTGGTPYFIDALAVDAACSGNPGPMEYRGVYIRTGQTVFKFGPMQGTNNIGEFLAIVHALALQEKQGTRLPIYSDSVNAQLWVRQGMCKTKLEENETTAHVFDMIRRAESWLRTHTFRLPIYKWETKLWGEIPADFGRK